MAKQATTTKSDSKLMDKLESEATELLDKFKEHPIRSLIYSLFILWAIKQIKEMWR